MKKKIPKFVEKYLREEIGCNLSSYNCNQNKKDPRKDLWKDEGFDIFNLKDFQKEDFPIIKPTLKVWKWLKKQKGGLNSSQP